MNSTPGRLGVSNPWRLLEQAETRVEKFLPVRERAIINAQSFDGAEILFPIVRPASLSLFAGVRLSIVCVIFSSLVWFFSRFFQGRLEDI